MKIIQILRILAPILAIGYCANGVFVEQIVYQRTMNIDSASWANANPTFIAGAK